MLYQMALTFKSVHEIPKCDHSIKDYWTVLSCNAVYYAILGGSNLWVRAVFYSGQSVYGTQEQKMFTPTTHTLFGNVVTCYFLRVSKCLLLDSFVCFAPCVSWSFSTKGLGSRLFFGPSSSPSRWVSLKMYLFLGAGLRVSIVGRNMFTFFSNLVPANVRPFMSSHK